MLSQHGVLGYTAREAIGRKCCDLYGGYDGDGCGPEGQPDEPAGRKAGIVQRRFSGGHDPITAVAAFGGLLVTIGFLIYARDIAAKGYALRDVLRVSMWPPKWWGIWWPRVLRRPGDVWECLPRSARLTRVLLTLMFASMVGWIVAAPSLSDGGRSAPRGTSSWRSRATAAW